MNDLHFEKDNGQQTFDRMVHRIKLIAVMVTFFCTFAIAYTTTSATYVNAKDEARFLNVNPKSIEDLKTIEVRVKQLLPKLKAATVGIRTGGGAGSGVIVSKDGYVLTAAHVVSEPGRNVQIILKDGKILRARSLGLWWHDAGLVKITDEGEYPFVEMGKSAELKLGDWAIAVGHPGGFDLRRKEVVRVGRIVMNEPSVIWSDCKLLPGDSGGPLFDINGRVIGIHSRITNIPFAGGVEGNFHVPVDLYTKHFESMKASRPYNLSDKPKLGVQLVQEEGFVRVDEVEPGSAALKGGLEPGDVITHFDHKPIKAVDKLVDVVKQTKPGDHVSFTVKRGKQELMIDLVMGFQPGSEPRFNITSRNLVKLDSKDRTNGTLLKDAYKSITNKVRRSVAEVKIKGKVVSSATVVDKVGLLVTKASEIEQDEDAAAIVCEFPDGGTFLAEVVGTDRVTDLALLKVGVKDLTPVSFAESKTPAVGDWLFTASPRHNQDLMGVYSVPARKLISKGVMGVSIDDVEEPVEGIYVTNAAANSGAFKVGMRKGDVITHLEKYRTKTRYELIDRLSDYGPGDVVKVKVNRKGKELAFEVELMDRDELFPVPERMFDRIRRVSGPVSKRKSGFSKVFQHDAPILPTHCGSPLMNLKGEVVGINIARVNRAETYALPADSVMQAVKKLKEKVKL